MLLCVRDTEKPVRTNKRKATSKAISTAGFATPTWFVVKGIQHPSHTHPQHNGLNCPLLFLRFLYKTISHF